MNGIVRLSAFVEKDSDHTPLQLYFDFRAQKEEQVDNGADPIAAALLLLAMRTGEALEIEHPISPRLHFSLPRIREIFCTWWPDLFSRVEIKTSSRRDVIMQPQPCAGVFFSGGVDSFYSLLKLQRQGRESGVPLTNLIFMRGVETRLSRSVEIESTEQWVRTVAASLGIEPIFGKTNIRDCVSLHWERHLHGSALAAVALCLSPKLGYVGIGSAFSYNHLIAHGSSPLTDEMYSTERLCVLHDGA